MDRTSGSPASSVRGSRWNTVKVTEPPASAAEPSSVRAPSLPCVPTSSAAASSLSGATLGTAAPEEVGDIELDALSRPSAIPAEADESAPPADERLASDLAPIDRGWGAWSYLVGAFILATVSRSFPMSYGLFLPAYLADPRFGSSPESETLLALVGTLSSGMMYCSGIVIYPLIARFPRSRKACLWTGAMLCGLSLFGSSYATNVSELVILQGILYGIGGAVLYAPCMSYLSEWFSARRATANGIIFAGTSAGGVLLPLVLPYLIRSYGVGKAVQYLSFAVLGSLIPALFLVKPRLRDPRVVRGGTRGRMREWMKSRSLWILMVANTIYSLAYFVPIIWLPTFASALNLTDEQGALALILVNGVSVLSRIALGILADRFSPWVLGLTTLGSVSVFTLVVWGYFATSLSTLLVYCVAYGVMAGGWTSLWTGFMKPITHDDPVSSTTVMGFLLLSRGIGNVLSAPISTALLRPQRGTGGRTGFEVGGSMFEGLIVYTGVLFGGAAVLVGAGWGLEWLLADTEEVEGRSR